MKNWLNEPWFWRSYVGTLLIIALLMNITDWSTPAVVSKLVWVVAVFGLYMATRRSITLDHADKAAWLIFGPALVIAVLVDGVVGNVALAIGLVSVLAWCWHSLRWTQRQMTAMRESQRRFDALREGPGHRS